MRTRRCIKVWQNRQHSQQISHQMAAGVPKECARAGEIVRQKSKQGAQSQKRDESHQVLAVSRGNNAEVPGSNGTETGAQSIHIIHEVERVNRSEDPKNSNGIMEKLVVDKERYAYSAGGNQRGNQPLSGKL